MATFIFLISCAGLIGLTVAAGGLLLAEPAGRLLGRWARLPLGLAASLVLLSALGMSLAAGLPGVVATGVVAVLVLGAAGLLVRQPALARQVCTRHWPLILAWSVLTIIASGFAALDPGPPPALPDGPYVYKQWDWPVQLQYKALDLPADNSIPYFVGEYLARDISFQDNRPLAPGQEVTNRTFLLSLLYLVPRYISGADASTLPVQSLDYAGTTYPDALTSVFDPTTFALFLGTGIALNALVVVGGLMLAIRGVPLLLSGSTLAPPARETRERPASVVLLWTALVLATTPFWVQQTFFTWPKGLALFFACAALACLQRRDVRSLAAAGGLMGLGYHSHPLVLVIAGALGFSLLFMIRDWRLLLAYGTSFALCVAPWVLYSALVLDIPSDLLGQNLLVDQSLLDHIAARTSNAYVTLAPQWLAAYPFELRAFLKGYSISYAGVVGVLVLVALMWSPRSTNASTWLRQRELWALMIFSAAVLTLVLAAFSRPNVVMFHAAQLPALLLLALLCRRTDEASRGRTTGLLAAQVAVNVLLLATWASHSAGSG
jgi:hypothetical protein